MLVLGEGIVCILMVKQWAGDYEWEFDRISSGTGGLRVSTESDNEHGP